jgi:hypothetical protein
MACGGSCGAKLKATKMWEPIRSLVTTVAGFGGGHHLDKDTVRDRTCSVRSGIGFCHDAFAQKRRVAEAGKRKGPVAGLTMQPHKRSRRSDPQQFSGLATKPAKWNAEAVVRVWMSHGPSFRQAGLNLVADEEREYGEERMLPVVQTLHSGTAKEALERIMSSVDGFVRLTRQHDDITCLVLWIM